MTAKPKGKKESKKKTDFLWLGMIILVTLITLFPTLKNEFVNWDDIVYIMNNDMIKSFSRENFWKIFSLFYMGNYHPFSILSFAFDYSIFGMDPFGYHFHNLIIHLVNVCLVYFFIWYLSGKKRLTSLIIALLFGIHPMHVESVVWISERKDLLYTAWYLLGLIAYLFYIKTSARKYYFWCLIAFLFSLLSKAQAVTFPMILILLDYVVSRKVTRTVIVEKIPFFVLSLVFGIIAIYAQRADDALNPIGIQWYEALFFGQYSFIVYILKFFIPFSLSCLHTYPLNDAGSAPLYIYFSPVVFLILFIVILKTWKTRRYITFGILFFLFSIFPVLQFLPVGQAIIAERYTYIPYIGLSILVVFFILEFGTKISPKGLRTSLAAILVSILIVFAYVSRERTKVWKDSISLWSDVIEKYPDAVTAYVNRGFIYNQYEKHQEAIVDCNTGMELDSTNYKLYCNRGIAHLRLKKYELAIVDFSLTIKREPDYFQAYMERGIIYTDNLGQYDLGIKDFMTYLSHDPNHAASISNLAVAYYKNNIYDSAMVYCQKSIEISPENELPYYIAAVIYADWKDFGQAYSYGMQARSLGSKIEEKLLNDWSKHAGNQMDAANKQ